MKSFLYAHATHPDPHMALALAAAQIEAQRNAQRPPLQPTLGWVYITEAYASRADALLAELRQRWPGVAWVGASSVGICANGVEYFDEPALALMLAELPANQFQVFSGVKPLARGNAQLVQVHLDVSPQTSRSELQELIEDAAVRTHSGYAFGGLTSGNAHAVHIADGVWHGGISGVTFGPELQLRSRVSQGCQALGVQREISACDGQLILQLDGQPALDCLLQDLGLPASAEPARLREALPRLRNTLVGLSDATPCAPRLGGAYGPDVTVRHLVGIDPARRGVAIAEQAELGQALSFCERNPEAAKRDLMRICTELRDEAEEQASAIAGALYISCAGRGGPHFGAPSAELQWVQHALGDVPLVGFFSGGEIAHNKLHGYTGVLTVFLK
jgi:small ligand-binding sensory domain FIST